MMPTGTPFVTGTTRERVVIALFSLPLAAVSVWAVVTGESVIRDIPADSTPARVFCFAVFRVLCTELFAAAAAFLLLAFIWAVFQPRWIGRLMMSVSCHVWRYFCLMVLSLFVLALIVKIVAHVT